MADPLDISAGDLRSLDRRLEYWLRRQRVGVSDLRLDAILGWRDYRARVAACLTAHIATDRPLIVVPGNLGITALHLALSDHPHCFVHSLEIAVGLQSRAGTAEPHAPKRLFNLATWRSGDRPEISGAMTVSADNLARIGTQYGIAVESVLGQGATAQALRNGLASADIVTIACHGQVDSRNEDVSFLLAHDGHLPPSVAKAYLAADNPFVFGWRELTDVGHIAPVVISSACDSGYSIAHESGERLGFDRALLRAGVQAYLAPLWPVAVGEIQELTCAIVDSYLSNPRCSLSSTAFEAYRAFEVKGNSPLTAQSMAQFGIVFQDKGEAP
jgi:hypothetical protein